MNILVADCNAASRKQLCEMLQTGGFTPFPAADAAEALKIMLGPGGPSLAVVDWNLPPLEGVGLCCRIRQVKHTPARANFILLIVRDEDIAAGLNSGADDYVTKPCRPTELVARLMMGAQLIDLQQQLVTRVRELEIALAEVKRFKEFLPICSSCKKVREDDNFWRQLEAYVSTHSGAKFTHGICPECASKLMNSSIAQFEAHTWNRSPASPLGE